MNSTSDETRLFLDTVFIQALLSRRDQYHEKARELWPGVQAAGEVWTTEAVLVEVGNALSVIHREGAAEFLRRCYDTENLHVVSVDTELLSKGLDLYSSRNDKTWGLTDCISFVVMHEEGLTVAVTADEHFVQAGFRALMAE